MESDPGFRIAPLPRLRPKGVPVLGDGGEAGREGAGQPGPRSHLQVQRALVHACEQARSTTVCGARWCRRAAASASENLRSAREAPLWATRQCSMICNRLRGFECIAPRRRWPFWGQKGRRGKHEKEEEKRFFSGLNEQYPSLFCRRSGCLARSLRELWRNTYIG